MKKKSSTKPAGIKLGDLVKDLITGFTGIASSRTEHLLESAKTLVLQGADWEARSDHFPVIVDLG